MNLKNWKGFLGGLMGGILVVVAALSFSNVTIGEVAEAATRLVRRHYTYTSGLEIPSGAVLTIGGTTANSGAVTHTSTYAHSGSGTHAISTTGAHTRSGSGTSEYSNTGAFTRSGTGTTLFTSSGAVTASGGDWSFTGSDTDVLVTGTTGDVRVSGGGDIVVTSTGDVQVAGTGDLTVAGQGKFKIQGATVKIPLNLFLAGTLGNITGNESDGILIGDLTDTAALCRQDDGGSFTSFTTECASGTSNIDFLPAVAEVNDAFYIGHATVPFAQVNIDTTSGVQGSTSMTVVHEYYNGSGWSTLTYGRQDVVDFDESVGDQYNTFEPPSNWTSTSVDSIAGYWMRIRVTAFTSSGTDPAGDTITLGITTDGTGLNMPTAGVITEVGFTAATVSGTNANSTFLIVNIIQGTHTVATFTKTTIIDNDDVTDLTFAAGDDILVMQLLEDGSTEHADVNLVLWLEL